MHLSENNIANDYIEHIPAQIGQRIKELRKKNNLNQRDLAKELNLSQSLLAKIELGSRNIQVVDFVKVAEYFNVSADYLIYGVETENKNAAEKYGLTNDALNRLKELQDTACLKIKEGYDEKGPQARLDAEEEIDTLEAIDFFISNDKGNEILDELFQYLTINYEAVAEAIAIHHDIRDKHTDKEASMKELISNPDYQNIINHKLGRHSLRYFTRIVNNLMPTRNRQIIEESDLEHIKDYLKNWRKELQNAAQE